jgi:hypothetical protein
VQNVVVKIVKFEDFQWRTIRRFDGVQPDLSPKYSRPQNPKRRDTTRYLLQQRRLPSTSLSCFQYRGIVYGLVVCTNPIVFTFTGYVVSHPLYVLLALGTRSRFAVMVSEDPFKRGN